MEPNINSRLAREKRGYRFSSLNMQERIKSREEAKTNKPSKKVVWKQYAVAVGILFVLYWVVSPGIKVVQLRYQLTDMKDQMIEYKNTNKMLQEEMNKMKTNQYIEDIARTKLGMVKEGEQAVYVNEVKPEAHGKEVVLKSQEKVGIYLKEWYEQMEAWMDTLKGKDGVQLWK